MSSNTSAVQSLRVARPANVVASPLRLAPTGIIAAMLLAVPAFSQAPSKSEQSYEGMVVCFGKYAARGIEGLAFTEREKAHDDLFHLTAQHINVVNDSSRRGGLPEILGTSFNGSTFQVAYLMPCNQIGEASARLLKFLQSGTPRRKLPAIVNVEFSSTTGESFMVDSVVRFPSEEIGQ
jgi:hypothetical protein